jgi:hypothetical protein
MRTPQRNFVVELKSGRRQPKGEASSIWGDTDLKAFARDVEDGASHPFNSSGTPGLPSAGGDMLVDPIVTGSLSEDAGDLDVLRAAKLADDGIEVDASERHPADHPAVEVVVQTPEAQPASRPQVTSTGAAQKRTKRPATHEIVPVSVSADGDQCAQSETAGDLLPFDEVAVLHAENKRLKRLLAEQLHAENLQLKKMLERFDLT